MKLQKRSLESLYYSITTYLPFLTHATISVIVINNYGVEKWGAFTQLLILQAVITHITSWGNRDYLLKVFSQNPATIDYHWQQSLFSRLFLLIPSGVITLWLLKFETRLLAIFLLWLIVSFLARSFDILILYYKTFNKAFWTELITSSGLVLLTFIYSDTFDLLLLMNLYVGFTLLKIILNFIPLRKKIFCRAHLAANWGFLWDSFPFFVPGFIGFIESRMDLYCMAIMGSHSELGQYQVLANCLHQAQAFAGFIFIPFAKSIYRIPGPVLIKVESFFQFAGITISFFSSIGIYILIRLVYNFDFSWLVYLMCMAYIFPFYLYYINIYLMFKYKKQHLVILVSTFAVFINIGINVLLIPKYGLTGALSAGLIGQWIVAICFYLVSHPVITSKALTVND